MDTLTGTTSGSPITGLTGTLTYAFSVASGTCDDQLSANGGTYDDAPLHARVRDHRCPQRRATGREHSQVAQLRDVLVTTSAPTFLRLAGSVIAIAC